MHSINAHNVSILLPTHGRQYEFEKIRILSSSKSVELTSLISRLLEYFTPSPHKEIQQLISRIRMLNVPYCETLALRLSELFRDSKEEDPEGPGIRHDSLSNVYRFFKKYPTLKCPALSLTPDYNLYASWKNGNNQVFSIHFISDVDVRYVVLRPNDQYPGRQIRNSGSTTYDNIMETVAPHKVTDWISLDS